MDLEIWGRVKTIQTIVEIGQNTEKRPNACRKKTDNNKYIADCLMSVRQPHLMIVNNNEILKTCQSSDLAKRPQSENKGKWKEK